ncbi:MAG: DUF4388 domain-containing protein [Myxococcota bacterium]
MSVALHGNLSDFGIAEVFQLIGQQRKTGVLIVGGEEDSIFLAFDAGCVVRGGPMVGEGDREPIGPQLVRSGYLTRAQLENLRTESARSARPMTDLILGSGLVDEATLAEVQHLLTKETVFDVMRRKGGDFNFTAEAVEHDTKPENLLGAEQILMDGLRMLDEWQTFASAIPSEDLVFRRLGNLDAAIAKAKDGFDGRVDKVERVLQLVDGRLSVRRVIDLARIGTFEAMRALAELKQTGVIDVVEEAAPVRAQSRRKATRKPLLPMLRAALATILPFVLLGWIGQMALTRGDGTGGVPGVAIPERNVAQLGGRYENARVRQLLEVHLYETGAYPEFLEEIAATAANHGADLDPERLAAYYYKVRSDEVVLLAPTD